MNLKDFLNIEVAANTTLGDILTVQFLTTILGNVLSAFLIISAALWFSGWVKGRIIHIAFRYERIDNTLFTFLGNLIRYAILTFSAVFVLNRFGVQTASLVAVIGAAGLAIGLALQGTLSNVAAGVMMILFRPFKVGDFIVAAGHMGTVKGINIVQTELATIGNVQIIIPNSDVWASAITNYSAYPDRCAEWTFGVSYDADLDKAEKVILDTIMADPRSRAEPEPFIKVNNLGDWSVDFLVRVWVAASDHYTYKADMRRAVKEALDEAGVGIPFPTRTVRLDGATESATKTDGPPEIRRTET